MEIYNSKEKTFPTKEETEKAFHYYGIKGLENLGLSDADVLRNIPNCYGGMKDTINKLHTAGWNFDRINKAQEDAKYQWTKELMEEFYKKAEKEIEKPNFQDEINELRGLVESVEDLEECANKLEADISTSKKSGKELKEFKFVVDELYRKTHIILAEKYLELAKIAEKKEETDLFETLIDNTNVMLTFVSPPEKLIKSFEEMRARLKTR